MTVSQVGFLDTFKHLLPSGAAWRLTIDKTLRRFFEGLAGGPADARSFLDDVSDDLSPDLTRALDAWEFQFGLRAAGPEITEALRRQRLDTAWKAQGGQSPRYLQDIIQAAGFPLFHHDWWSSGPAPYVTRDPHDYAIDPTIGLVQCGEPLAQCGEPTALCNNWLANFPRYYVNLDLTRRPPPPLPGDPTKYPFFVYFGAEDLDAGPVDIPVERRAELEELLLRICPAHLWIVLMVRWVEFSGARITLQGDTRVTLQGDARITLGT